MGYFTKTIAIMLFVPLLTGFAACSPKETTPSPTPVTDVMIGETLDAQYAKEFTVSKAFSDNMIVQRGEHIRVW